MKKIITVHGIMSDNTWAQLFNDLLSKTTDVKIYNFEYGFFSLLKFLRGSRRQRVIQNFQQFYAENFDGDDTPPSIVCHSFGTYIFFSSIKKYDTIKFDRVVLCGSILARTTDWLPFFKRGQIRYAYNDYGKLDSVVALSPLVIRSCGTSGKYGFTNIPDELKEKVIQHKNSFAHSDYFYKPHLRTWITQLLGPVRKNFKYNKTILRDEIIDRIYSNLEQNSVEVAEANYFARIDENGDYFATYVKRGTNTSNSSISHYSFRTSADSAEDADDMGFKAYDSNGNALQIETLSDELNSKHIEIKFKGPIEPQQPFEFTYHFRWKDTISFKRGDTDHFEIKAAAKVNIGLNFKFPLQSPRFFIVKDRHLAEEKNATRKNERDGTITYHINFENDSEYDGVIFYFEGSNPPKSFYPGKPIRLFNKSLMGIDLYTAASTDIKQVYRLELDIEDQNAATENILHDRLTTFNDGFIVAKEKNKVIGYVETIIWQDKQFETFDEIKNFPILYDPNGDTLYVIFLAVDEKNRGRKIGHLMLEGVERLAVKHNVKKIQLVAREGLIPYYEKIGFNTVRMLPEFLPGRDYQSALMENILS